MQLKEMVESGGHERGKIVCLGEHMPSYVCLNCG
jgi:hypothetical protein